MRLDSQSRKRPTNHEVDSPTKWLSPRKKCERRRELCQLLEDGACPVVNQTALAICPGRSIMRERGHALEQSLLVHSPNDPPQQALDGVTTMRSRVYVHTPPPLSKTVEIFKQSKKDGGGTMTLVTHTKITLVMEHGEACKQLVAPRRPIYAMCHAQILECMSQIVIDEDTKKHVRAHAGAISLAINSKPARS